MKNDKQNTKGKDPKEERTDPSKDNASSQGKGKESKDPKSNNNKGQGSNNNRNKRHGKKGCNKGDKKNGSSRNPGEPKDPKDPKEPKSPMKGDNGPEWYIADEQLVKDTCSLAFPKALGVIRSFLASKKIGVTEEFTKLVTSESVIVVMDLLHSIPGQHTDKGGAVIFNNGMNIAANRMYTYVRHANSGHSNYESSDLFIYLVAIAAIRAAIEDAKRAYSLAMFAAIDNRAFPKAILDAMGCSYLNLSTQLADFRGKLNNLIVQLGGLAVPDVFTLEDRWTYLSKKVFLDEENSKAQVIVPKFTHLPVYDPTDENGGCLRFKELHRGTISQWCKDIQEAITALVTDEDINIMSGDILKAYGAEGIKKYDLIPEDLSPDISYDEEFLHQYHNTTIFKPSTITNKRFIKQQDNKLYLDQDTYVNSTLGSASKILFNNASRVMLDVHRVNPTPVDVLESTRLTTGFVLNDGDVTVLMTSGSEIVTRVAISYNVGVAEYSTIEFSSNVKFVNITIDDDYTWTSAITTAYELTHLSYYSEIAMTPQLYIGIQTIHGSGDDRVANECVCGLPLWNTENMTELDLERLGSINDQVALGMLIPAANRLTYVK